MKTKADLPRPKRGRPRIEIKKVKVSVSVPSTLLGLAKMRANKSGESLSGYVSRAIQSQTLSDSGR